MKRALFLGFTVLLCYACTCKPTGHHASVISYFGDSISWEAEAIEAHALMQWMGEKDSADLRVRGTVAEVCQTKGCWMDMDLGGGELMTVRFKDYGFFMPKDCAGNTVVLEGTVKREVEDVAWLRHKAQDAGKSPEEIEAITEPLVSFTFLARGVAMAETNASHSDKP